MWEKIVAGVQWILGPEIATEKHPGHLWTRWIWLRALGLIYFSAFYSLLFQIRGLIGPHGILPAADYLQAVAAALHAWRFWYAPTLLWFSASNHALVWICWAGMIAALLATVNLWPRGMLVVCFVCYLSFVSAAQDFSGYQSDGMLLEAGFISLFFAPPGFWPELGRAGAPSRLSRFLLQWEWFRIYFESGVAKMMSGDIHWRNLTAMDDYYQNGPLPTWIGWYVQQLPHWFHASTAFLTLLLELALVWMMFLPRRFRIICFWIVTPFEIGIILTANYTFLNYIVLSLAFLLLDDAYLKRVLPQRLLQLVEGAPPASKLPEIEKWRTAWRRRLAPVRMGIAAVFLGWILYATTAEQIWAVSDVRLPFKPVQALEPFRIANRFGLFAVMTPERYEIEFQGTRDGKTWLAYPFRYKPQDLMKPPGIYAPYQPRFDWNLRFASLGSWRESRFVVWTEERLLKSEPDVLELFAGDPFAGGPPPVQVRTVIWHYWFTGLKTKRANGTWWHRELMGEYAPALAREPDGKIVVIDSDVVSEPQQSP
ncbi:MAG TPA: lipase maturation factor family protein [Candidatus Sulfotelmatobacter sp.]|nr:lipase maturation factor family protein [Candidatus Sulfotelmatobacter sp.]